MADNLLELADAPEVQAVLIRRYPAQDVLRYIGQFQDSFAQYVGAAVDTFPANQSTPPPQPRYGFKGNKKVLQVSNVSAQLNLSFSSGLPRDGILSAISRAASEMDKLDTIFAHHTRTFSGIVVTVTYTVSNANLPVLVNAAAQRVLSNAPDRAQSLNFTISRRVGDFFRNVEFGQVKAGMVAAQAGQNVHIDLDFDSGFTDGIEYKIDVNSKPRMDSPQTGDFNALIAEFKAMLNDDAPIYLGDLLDTKIYGN
jgi:hypothetical protein